MTEAIGELPSEVIAAARPVHPKRERLHLPANPRGRETPTLLQPKVGNELPDYDDAQKENNDHPFHELGHGPVENAGLPRKVSQGGDQDITSHIARQEGQNKRDQQDPDVQRPTRQPHASAPQARTIVSRHSTAARISRSVGVRSP